MPFTLDHTKPATTLRKLRVARFGGLRRAGRVCGLPPSTLRAYELGVNEPSADARERLELIFGEPWAQLTARSEDPQ